MYWDGSALTLSNAVIETNFTTDFTYVFSIEGDPTKTIPIKLFGTNKISDLSSTPHASQTMPSLNIICENENVHNLGIVSSLEINTGKGLFFLSKSYLLSLEKVNVIFKLRPFRQ